MTSPLPIDVFPEERRLATVLFADVQGFTPLSERLDFETISDLIKEVWRRLDTIIETHGGYIDKHIGDAVMAVWGAPYADENDAERAVSAAIELQETMLNLVKESTIPDVKNLKLRVGINSGSVLAGYVGLRNEYTVMGDTVNIANRLEQSAEPGSIVIGESTYRLVRGVFRVQRFEAPLALRGRTEPVQAYKVLGVTEQPSRMRYKSIDSLETRLVGRETELARLEGYFKEAMQQDYPTLVLVTGDAGMGKSRLLMEFMNHLEATQPALTQISARALAQTQQIPFFIWKSLWNIYFGVQDTDSPEIVRQKYTREIHRLWGLQLGPVSSVEAAHFIGSLAGHSWPDSPFLHSFAETPEKMRLRAFEMTAELLRRMSRLHPTVLLLDDLQWADQGSLDLLAYLIEGAQVTEALPEMETSLDQSLPLFVLASARYQFVGRNPRWANLSRLVQLEPLPVNAETVAAAYPDLRNLPSEVLQELAERTDGNPYFMEEVAKSLVKSGALAKDLPAEDILKLLRENPPESLRVVLQARLDALSREARTIGLLASVVGRVFWVGAVVAAARVSSETGPLQEFPETVMVRLIQDALRQLVRAELAFPRAHSNFSEEQEYIFKHSLLRDVAYGLIPHKNRTRFHLAVADWMAKRQGTDFNVMAAEHYEQGGAFSRAARHYENAAELALLSGDVQVGQNFLAHARKLRGLTPKEEASS